MAAEFVVKVDIDLSEDQRSEFEQAICKAVLTKVAEMDFTNDVNISRNLAGIGNGGPIGLVLRKSE